MVLREIVQTTFICPGPLRLRITDSQASRITELQVLRKLLGLDEEVFEDLREFYIYLFIQYPATFYQPGTQNTLLASANEICKRLDLWNLYLGDRILWALDKNENTIDENGYLLYLTFRAVNEGMQAYLANDREEYAPTGLQVRRIILDMDLILGQRIIHAADIKELLISWNNWREINRDEQEFIKSKVIPEDANEKEADPGFDFAHSDLFARKVKRNEQEENIVLRQDYMSDLINKQKKEKNMPKCYYVDGNDNTSTEQPNPEQPKLGRSWYLRFQVSCLIFGSFCIASIYIPILKRWVFVT